MSSGLLKNIPIEYIFDSQSKSITASTTTSICSKDLTEGTWLCFFYARASVSNSGTMNVTVNCTNQDSYTVRTSMNSGGGAISSGLYVIPSTGANLYGSVYFAVAATCTARLFAIKLD